MSTMLLALNFCKCLIIPNTRAVVISHEEEATKRLFRRVKFFADRLIARPKLDKESEQLYSFRATNSTFYIGKAGSRAFGRGDSITDLHCSEISRWPNAGELMSGLKEAVGDHGTITVECTANGYGGTGAYFANLWKQAMLGQAWQPLFLSWADFPEYERDATGFIPTAEELALQLKYPQLTLRKLAWRRWKIAETIPYAGYTAEQLFRQEYPLTPDEAFLTSGNCIFDTDALLQYIVAPGKESILHGGKLVVWQEPKEAYSAMGADVAEGVTLAVTSEGDAHAVEILDRTYQQIAEWTGHCDTDEFAKVLQELGYRFHGKLGVEANNQGIAVLQPLKKLYPLSLQYHRQVFDENYKKTVPKLGWNTNRATKEIMLSRFVAMVREHTVRLHSQELIDDCLSTVREDDGTVNTQGKDRLMAMAIAIQVADAMPYSGPVKSIEQTQREEKEIKWRKKHQQRNLQRTALDRLLYANAHHRN